MKIRALVILTLLSISVLAQDYPREKVDIDAYVDDLFQQQDEGVNYELLYENLVNYYQNPINLNKTNYEELSTLLVLSDQQIKNLLRHIEKNGKLLSIYELQSVDGFDLNTIYRMIPFMKVDDVVMNIDAGHIWRRIWNEDNNSIIYRTERTLEPMKGYNPEPKEDGTLPSHYLGSAWKQYIRYRVSHKNDFSIGLLAEKDAGEQFVWDPETKRFGMDFYSFHFHTYNKGRFKKIAIGDYQVQYGQSLVFAGGFLIGKGAETINSIRRTNVGIRPYTSAIENGFFRGAAATYEITDRLDVTVMGSRKKLDISVDSIDATLNDIGDIVQGVVFQGDFEGATSNHDTESNLAKKHTLTELNAGSHLAYSSKDKNLQVGASFLYTAYSDSLAKQDRPYNVNEFKGKENYILGADYTYNWQNFNFFGEVAQSKSGGVGLVQGVVGSLSNKLQIAVHLRYFESSFHSSYGTPFLENSAGNNEKGMYWGMKYKFNPKWELSAYYDRFAFPWLRFQVDQPSYGDEYLGRLHYKPKRGVAIYFQHKNETKLKNQSDNITKLNFAVPTTKQTQLINIDYRISNKINLKSRVQWSYHQQSNEPTVGYALIQDFNFKFSGKWRLSTRYAIFETDNWDNRQYAYEKDVLYAYSIYTYSGTGVRKFILIRYTPIRRVDIWVKLARTTYDYQPDHKISSGLREIDGNVRTDLRMQMRYKF